MNASHGADWKFTRSIWMCFIISKLRWKHSFFYEFIHFSIKSLCVFFLSSFRFYNDRSTLKRAWTNWSICLSSINDCAIRWISPLRIWHNQIITTTTQTTTTIIIVIQEVSPHQQQLARIARIPAQMHAVRIRQVMRPVWMWHQLSNQILKSPQSHSQVPQRMFKMSRFSHSKRKTNNRRTELLALKCLGIE